MIPIFYASSGPAAAPLGVLQAMNSHRGKEAGFAASDTLTLRLLAVQASVAIANAQGYDASFRAEVQVCNHACL